MSDFVEENIRIIPFNNDEIPTSLIYKLPDDNFTFSATKFGISEHLEIEFYERLFEKRYPGLLYQFPMLYYLVEDWFADAIKLTSLEHLLKN